MSRSQHSPIDFEIIEESSDGYALLKSEDGRATVVRLSSDRSQVYSAMPGDMPRYGAWFAAFTTAGVCYVSSWYSRGYARRVYRRLSGEG